ncbi:hypothetical protein Slala02_20610 [Streptomyces lavendulae subsp. lavendulae]|nr:hypothetical protein Slala01_15410 [Streptomyces lavendulae subsp. lavendulae]GLX26241.1 hypothetical protein Slala02_20610 [Streptomyces lavendulae subsp. lavendulae]
MPPWEVIAPTPDTTTRATPEGMFSMCLTPPDLGFPSPRTDWTNWTNWMDWLGWLGWPSGVPEGMGLGTG